MLLLCLSVCCRIRCWCTKRLVLLAVWRAVSRGSSHVWAREIGRDDEGSGKAAAGYMSAWCLSDGSEARGSRQLNGLFLLFDARVVVLLAVVVVSS